MCNIWYTVETNDAREGLDYDVNSRVLPSSTVRMLLNRVDAVASAVYCML